MDQSQNYAGIVANPYGTKGSQLLNAGVPQGSMLPSVSNTVNATDIVGNKALNVPQSTGSQNFTNELLANYQSNLNNLQNQQQQATGTIQDLMSQLVGQTGDRITAENQAGLPQLNTQLRDLQTLSQRQLAAYAQNTLNSDINAQGLTRTAQSGNQELLNRQHGIDAMITNANISAISGQIQTAQAQVDRAMSLKYDPIKQVIENQKFILDQVNTKEARAASNVKDLQLKQLEQQQNEEKAIQNIGLKLAEYGQDPSIIKNAKSLNEAIQLAGSRLQDPKSRLELEKIRLDMEKTRKEISLLGEPTPKEKKEEADLLKTKEGQNQTLKDKLDLINIIEKSQGLQQRVGPNIQTRTPATFGGGIKQIVTSPFGVGNLIYGGLQEATGQGQQFAGAVHRLASNEFLNALINAKGQGATFGALSDREGNALRAAATQLNDWEIKDKNGNGLGRWDIDEKSFLQEVNRIKTLAQKALGNNIISQEENGTLNTIFSSDNQAIDPANFYK